MKLLLTCEHGGNNIPKNFAQYFEKQEHVLNSHRGYDIGALDVYKTLQPISDYSKHAETSRLLIELNRSLHHPKLFSEFTKNLLKEEKQYLINNYYLPYRNTVEEQIKQWISKNETVLHVSIHSFTPVLNEKERHCDVGLLFDPRSKDEKMFCSKLKSALKNQNPQLSVRFNYPYLGKADGFTTYLRKQFKSHYLGVEIELNQKFARNNAMVSELKDQLLFAIKSLS